MATTGRPACLRLLGKLPRRGFWGFQKEFSQETKHLWGSPGQIMPLGLLADTRLKASVLSTLHSLFSAHSSNTHLLSTYHETNSPARVRQTTGTRNRQDPQPREEDRQTVFKESHKQPCQCLPRRALRGVAGAWPGAKGQGRLPQGNDISGH